MRDGAGLEVADVVGRVMHELHMPDAAPMRLLEPLELGFEKVEAFDVADDRGLSRLMRGLEIGRGERAAQAVLRDHLVHPGESIEMVFVELAGLRLALGGREAGRVPAEERTVRHIGEAHRGQRSRAHPCGEIVAGRRQRRDPGRPAMAVDIDGDRSPQDLERRRHRVGCLRRRRRAAQFRTAAEHRAEGRQRRAPHPLPARERIAVTAAIHVVLPRERTPRRRTAFGGPLSLGPSCDASAD
jgi:hypothetical protein